MAGEERTLIIMQAKEKRKQEIIAIFEAIRPKLKLRTSEEHRYSIVILDEYKKELLKETDYLSLEYDHPLRAAWALEKAINNPGVENYQAFEKEAIDSKFYPQTRAAAHGILFALGFTALVVIVGAIILASAGVALGPILTFGGFAAAYSLLSVAGPGGHMWGGSKYESYAPVTESIRVGQEVADHLKLFKPRVARPVDNVSPEYVATLPIATTVS